uniref:Uncharacterized protein n=1 Tax=Knipowitschia caucasica TaxID=637954 RepID=A0AAV2J7H3_KNICA
MHMRTNCRSHRQGLCLKMVQPFGPLHCSTNQKLQQSLREERRRSHQLHQQLRDQKTITEELVQLYLHREDELNLKCQESVALPQEQIAKESFLQESRDREVRVDQRIRQMCRQLSEKEPPQTQLQDDVTLLKQAVNQLHQQLRDQKTITEELVQLYLQREEELNLKCQESVEGAADPTLGDTVLEQLERKVRFKDLQGLEKRVQALQQELISKEGFLQESRDREVRVDQRFREMCQQLCEKENSQTQLQNNVTSLKQAVNQLHLHLKDQQDQCQQNEARLKDQYEQNEARLKDKYEQNEARLKDKYEQNEARLRDECQQIDARLKKKEEYIRLLKRDMTERENLFRSQFLLHNKKVEKQRVECGDPRVQLQQEQQLTLNLKGELHGLREAERSEQHKTPRLLLKWLHGGDCSAASLTHSVSVAVKPLP